MAFSFTDIYTDREDSHPSKTDRFDEIKSKLKDLAALTEFVSKDTLR